MARTAFHHCGLGKTHLSGCSGTVPGTAAVGTVREEGPEPFQVLYHALTVPGLPMEAEPLQFYIHCLVERLTIGRWLFARTQELVIFLALFRC